MSNSTFLQIDKNSIDIHSQRKMKLRQKVRPQLSRLASQSDTLKNSLTTELSTLTDSSVTIVVKFSSWTFSAHYDKFRRIKCARAGLACREAACTSTSHGLSAKPTTGQGVVATIPAIPISTFDAPVLLHDPCLQAERECCLLRSTLC